MKKKVRQGLVDSKVVTRHSQEPNPASLQNHIFSILPTLIFQSCSKHMCINHCHWEVSTELTRLGLPPALTSSSPPCLTEPQLGHRHKINPSSLIYLDPSPKKRAYIVSLYQGGQFWGPGVTGTRSEGHSYCTRFEFDRLTARRNSLGSLHHRGQGNRGRTYNHMFLSSIGQIFTFLSATSLGVACKISFLSRVKEEALGQEVRGSDPQGGEHHQKSRPSRVEVQSRSEAWGWEALRWRLRGV